jgi:ribose 5-phosphate isomerase A
VDQQFAALAARALEFVPDGSRIGLGSGRTATAFLEKLGERVRGGWRVRAVASSEAIARQARALGIPVDDLDGDELLEVTVDGADEVERSTLNLVKGKGGALVRERLVAAASRRQVILVTAEKLVNRLGERTPLPVEVIPFALAFCRQRLQHLGFRPVWRGRPDKPYLTDNGNYILDCETGPMADPAGVHHAIRSLPGVLDTGLFLGTADVVLVAEGNAVRELHR